MSSLHKSARKSNKGSYFLIHSMRTSVKTKQSKELWGTFLPSSTENFANITINFTETLDVRQMLTATNLKT